MRELPLLAPSGQGCVVTVGFPHSVTLLKGEHSAKQKNFFPYSKLYRQHWQFVIFFKTGRMIRCIPIKIKMPLEM